MGRFAALPARLAFQGVVPESHSVDGVRLAIMKIKLDISRLRQFVRLVRFPVWVISGTVSGSQDELTVFYGGPEAGRIYLIKQMLGDNPNVIYLGKKWFWNVKKTSCKYSCAIEITPIMKTWSRLVAMLGGIYIPCWVEGEIDFVSQLPKYRKGKSVRGDMRRIRKNNLGYEVTRKAADLDLFYHEMYLPLMNKSHGEGALLMGYDKMMERVDSGKCELLFIKHGGERIAGVLIRYQNGMPRAWSVGIRDANRQYLRIGAIAATYYFTFQYLKDQGYQRVNEGLSRPFLNDGVLQYKKKWGVNLIGTSADGFILKLRLPSEALFHLLINSPFLMLGRDGLEAVIFADHKRLSEISYWEEIEKNYYISGIKRLVIYPLTSRISHDNVDIPPLFRGNVVIRSLDSLFSKSCHKYTETRCLF